MKNNLKKVEKKTYITPQLTVHGDVEVITLGFKTGSALDKAFPDGTPTTLLTFS